ncbi:hypothetical protein DFH06DRAFT_1200456 [Mycena polygramma]|nr:hypothetical protein DFH06DRAFT_1200456 [Mycena polygramma]
MIFIDLPRDILLEVLKFSELPDALSLLSTCSSIYSLYNQRSFWISVLETTRAKSPIGCPPHADLSLYGLEALRVLAVSWLRLQGNWSQSFPQIKQPLVQSTWFIEPTQIVFNVQGTEIIVLNSGRVYCWDAELGKELPFPAVEVGPDFSSVGSVSAPIEAPGVWTLAFLADRLNTAGVSHIYIITIKHDGGNVISFTNECHQLSVTQGTHFDPVFLTEDVVGTVVAGNDQDQCIISVGPLSALRCPLPSTIVLKLHRPVSDDDLVICSVYKGHLYILLDDNTSVHIYHVSQESLRSGHCERSSLYKSEITSSYDSFRDFCFMLPSTPFYGVTAIYLRLEDVNNGAESVTSFTFLPNTHTYDADPEVSSPLAFDSVCVTEYVSGTPLDVSLVWMGHSGFNVVAVLVNDPDDSVLEIDEDNAVNRISNLVYKLVLVRYHPETRRTSQHTLVVPDAIDLRGIEAVCIDDTTGAIHLLDRDGLFSTLRYV